MQTIKFKIKRSGRRSGEKYSSFIQAYALRLSEGMTVLQALIRIIETQDTTLSLRMSCRSAICGSCAMMINGVPKLACKTQVMEEYKGRGEILIEPLANHTVVKDLIVDLSPFFKKMSRITPFLQPSDDSLDPGFVITGGDTAKVDNVQQCIMCGSCNASCSAIEANSRFAGPAALAKSWRFVGDVREDNAEKRLAKLSEDNGMWDCVRCVQCTEYCPKGVEPLKAIELLRSEAVKAEITENHGARHVESMVNSVKRVGRLDEAAMTFKTLGFLRSVGMIPFGFKMELHGKMPMPMLFPKIKGIDEVRKIMDDIEDKRREKGRKEKK